MGTVQYMERLYRSGVRICLYRYQAAAQIIWQLGIS